MQIAEEKKLKLSQVKNLEAKNLQKDEKYSLKEVSDHLSIDDLSGSFKSVR
jgi:hypothetical protein